jgi:hypothetical protein
MPLRASDRCASAATLREAGSGATVARRFENDAMYVPPATGDSWYWSSPMSHHASILGFGPWVRWAEAVGGGGNLCGRVVPEMTEADPAFFLPTGASLALSPVGFLAGCLCWGDRILRRQ